MFCQRNFKVQEPKVGEIRSQKILFKSKYRKV